MSGDAVSNERPSYSEPPERPGTPPPAAPSRPGLRPGSREELSTNRYAALVGAQVPQAWGIEAAGCSLRQSARGTQRWTKRASPKSAPPASVTERVHGLLPPPSPVRQTRWEGLRGRDTATTRGWRQIPAPYLGVSTDLRLNPLRRSHATQKNFSGRAKRPGELWVMHSASAVGWLTSWSHAWH